MNEQSKLTFRLTPPVVVTPKEELDVLSTSFDLDRPDEMVYVHRTQTNGGSMIRKNWFKFMIATLSAVLTGVLLGLMVLSFVYNSGESQTVTGTVPSSESGSIIKTDTIGVFLPEQVYYSIQYGVFSKLESVETVQKELQQNVNSPLASTYFREDDRFHLLIGLNTSQEMANRQKEFLEGLQMNVFVKEFKLFDLQIEPQASVWQKSLAKNLQTGRSLADRLLHSIEQQSDEVQTFNHQSVMTAHKEWLSQSRSFEQTDHTFRQQLKTMNAELNLAYISWSEFVENRHPAMAQNIEISVLNYVSQGNHMIELLKKQ